MIQISDKFALELKHHLEEVAVQIDYEWGDCRPLEQLLRDDAMPGVYDKLVRLMKEASK